MRTAILLLTFLLSISAFAQDEMDIQNGDEVIHLTTFGEGEPILIINGGPGMNSRGFGDLAKTLGQSNMAIIYDQRGTGSSTIPKVDKSTVTIDLMLKDIEVIREHLKIDKWIIFGHSFGGMLGSYYTSKFPERVKGLILSSSGGINMDLFARDNISPKLTDMEKDSLAYWRDQIAAGDTSYHAQLQWGKYLAPAYLFDKSHVPTIARRLTQVNREINGLVFQSMRDIDFDCSEDLKEFKSPVLIIQGKQDVVPPQIAETAKKVLQNSTVVLMDSCGHYGWLDQPEVYFGSIEKFLAELG